jgi:hypothetical protein
MVFRNFSFSRFFNKRLLLQFYFIFFIILNVLDFMNRLEGDLDFFKKLLSWTLIAYIFYRVSFSKIFIGIRLRVYDLFFILAFSLIAIPKALLLYSKNLNIGDFYFFKFFFKFLNMTEDLVLILSFLGIIFGVILVISLVSNHNYKKESFLGSFRFRDNFLGHLLTYILLIMYSLFLGLIVFNLFMEWFALAVDAVILVLGVIYYLVMYVHKHTKIKTNFVSSVSNSGNIFLKNLIEMFSNKKTFFVGVSFLLVLHLLVDAGVYMVPYVVGTENALYSSGEIGGNHPLFNFFDFSKSLIYSDLTQLGASDFFVTSAILLIYLIAIFLGFSLLVLPFYILYKNIEKKKIYFSKFFVISFLSSIVFYLFFIFIEVLKFPLGIRSLKAYEGVRGISIYTNPIIDQNVSSEVWTLILILSIVVFLFLFLRYEKYKFFYEKTLYVFLGLFLVFYIMMYFGSVVGVEYDRLGSILLSEEINFDYDNLYQGYKNDEIKRDYDENYYGNIVHFSQFSMNMSGKRHDFILGDVKVLKNHSFSFGNFERVYLSESSSYDFELSEITSEDFKFIYYVGIDRFIFINGEVDRIFPLQIYESFNIEKGVKANLSIEPYIVFIRFILLSMFYIFGTLTFVWFYTKKNILDM